MSTIELDERSSGRALPPRSLIITVFGLYLREFGGWISIKSLIALMAELGIDSAALRSSISRLKRRGVVVSQKRDGRAGYALSDLAQSILVAGDRRIFERRTSTDSGWILAVFSVPESQRELRHQLRSRLTWLGFGTVTSGVWVAQAHVLQDAQTQLTQDGLDGYVDLFRADYLGFAEVAEKVTTWWDISALQRQYDQFIDEYAPVLARWSGDAPDSPPGDVGARAFVDYTRALTAWRRLPYLDPGLPAELLPEPWSGARAAELFFELRERLDGLAQEHARTVTLPGV